ncbi:restriction endonuclease subunit S [Bordetella hinzii]|uniref:restriction endonuclease subunit S n=1 Tax=Bordetella hinzii TaxID=103855 RepID=UPI0005187CC8|nr:restriction endonuclease subunit S [Bordetella hinzii]
MIPDEWRVVRFAEIADYKAGRTPARANPEYWDGAGDGVPWVAISDMTEFDTVTATKEKISRAAFEHVFRSQAVRAGTLIMSFKLTIGRVATLGVDACHNEAIISIYPKPEVDQRYLGYFLAQVDYDALQDRQVKGNTLNQEKIDRIEVLLPPLDEQSSIANVLDLLRHSIDLQDRALATAEDLKRSAMRELFTRGLRGEPQKETEIGPVPESWVLEPIGAHFSVVSGGTPSRGNPAYWIGGNVPWVKTTEVDYCEITETEEHITPEGLENSAAKLLPKGTLLMAMYGQGITRGKVAILGIEAACNQASAAMSPLDDAVPTRFLYHFLTWQYEEIRSLAHGGQQQNLNLEIVRSLLVVVPPTRAEQDEIVAILDAIDRKIDLHRKKRVVLEELFKALLHKLMTGEIRADELDLSALDRVESEAEEAVA